MITHMVLFLSDKMSHALLGWLKRSFILVDALIRLHLRLEPTLLFTEITLANCLYLRYYYLNHTLE